MNVEIGLKIAGFLKIGHKAYNAYAALVNQILSELKLSTTVRFNVKKVRMMIAIGLTTQPIMPMGDA
ncbi:hypothetical protein QQX98_007054 [Neonectria punicea]|uniref:Uncharacterized protein n=1 Tax=Neonectria punicea TaxID=979145 RepID=A0ABR1GZ87_9HYPO